jgi:predicted amidohydrolase YtcJ
VPRVKRGKSAALAAGAVPEIRRPISRGLSKEAIPTGLTPPIHAIGDKGKRIILDIEERLLTTHDLLDRDHRWRVIHAQVVHPDDFSRVGRLKRADLAVFDTNLVEVGRTNPAGLLKARVLYTSLGGRVVHRAGAD